MGNSICDHCGKSYDAQRSSSKYCSTACQVAAARERRGGGKEKPVHWGASATERHRKPEGLAAGWPDDEHFGLLDPDRADPDSILNDDSPRFGA